MAAHIAEETLAVSARQRVAELEQDLARVTALLHELQERAHDKAGISTSQSAEVSLQRVTERDEFAEGKVHDESFCAALGAKTQTFETLTQECTRMRKELAARVNETELLQRELSTAKAAREKLEGHVAASFTKDVGAMRAEREQVDAHVSARTHMHTHMHTYINTC